MASTSAPSPRRLAELLDEQQEPFVLEVYLLERGCRPRNLELQGQAGCCASTSNSSSRNNSTSRFLKRSSTYHGQTTISSKSSGQFSSMARILYSKLVSINHVFGFNNAGLLGRGKQESKHRASRKEKDAVVESGRISSTSSSSLCYTCTESDMEAESISSPTKNANYEMAPERVMPQWRSVDENKECSPVSVLDEIDFVQSIPVYNVRQQEAPSASRVRIQKKVPEDSILSASLWELLNETKQGKTKQPRSELLPQYVNSKKVMQQSKQLMFDCVREVVENAKRLKTMRKQKGLMGPEEIGKIICNNLKTWSKLSTDETNINQLLRKDLILTSNDEQWGSSEVSRKEMAFEIGDGMLVEVTEEIVRDMIEGF